MTLTVWVIGTGESPFVFNNVTQQQYDIFKNAVLLKENKFIRFSVGEYTDYILPEYVTAFAVKNEKEEQNNDAE